MQVEIPKTFKMKYTVSKVAEDCPYACYPLVQVIALSFFGHGPGAITFDLDQFPDEAYPEDIDNVGKEIPQAMAAYGATIVRNLIVILPTQRL